MESRWTKIGNHPEVTYLHEDYGNKLHIACVSISSEMIMSFTNPSEPLIALCRNCCNLYKDSKGHSYLMFKEECQKDPAKINYFLDALNACYPVDEAIRQTFKTCVDNLAKANAQFGSSYGTYGMFAPAYTPAYTPTRSTAWDWYTFGNR